MRLHAGIITDGTKERNANPVDLVKFVEIAEVVDGLARE